MTKGKIKVLETIRQGKIGGGESHVLDLVEELDKNIYEPVVLAFTEGPMIDKLKAMRIKTYVVPTETPFDISKWQQVKQIMQHEKIELVHAHGTRANSNVFWAAKQLGLPVVYTVHGWSFHPDQNFLTRFLRIKGEEFLSRQANITICVSDNNLKDALKQFSLPNAAVIKYGINLKKFNPDNNYKNVRQDYGIASDTTVVGYVARITTQKDPFTMMKAIAQVPAGLNVKFLVIGDGELKTSMLKLAHQLGIESRIIFSDFRQDVPDILNAVDIYCLPSLWEGLPIGLLEAMAMKKAIVASAVDGTKEVITDEQNGFLVPPQCPDKLANALTRLVTNPELIHTFGDKAYEVMKEQFNVATMTRKVERIYTRLLGISNPPQPSLTLEQIKA